LQGLAVARRRVGGFLPPGVAALVALLTLAAPASAGTSVEANPTVVFGTTGLQTVTLEVCDGGRCSTQTKTVMVLDPEPEVTAAALTTANTEVGHSVGMSGAATGRPPLDFSWRIELLGAAVATLPGSTAVLSTSGLAPGAYTARLVVTNSAGSDASAALPLTVGASSPLAFYTVVPCRILDTRSSAPLLGGAPRRVAVAGACGIPATAHAVSANVTITGATAPGHVQLYPAGEPAPTASNVSFGAGQTRAASALLGLGTDGSVDALAGVGAAGAAHLIIDVNGYYAP
jgi:PKD repeat protein